MTRATVIGGGIAGVLVAERISSVVDDVRLVEKNQLGSGTTGKSIANVATHIGDDDVLHALIERSWSVYEPLVDRGVLSFHNCGYLKVIDSQERFEQECATAETLRQRGRRVETLSPVECADLGIEESTVGAGGIYFPGEGRLDPGEILSHFSTVAADAGVRIETGVEVTAIDRDGSVFHVDTSEGGFETDLVVNAAGPWAPQINDLVGVSLPLKHTLAPIAVLEPETRPSIPTVAFENGAYFTPEESRKVLAGRFPPDLWADAEEYDPDAVDGMGIAAVTEAHRNLMVETALERIPALRDAGISNGWQAARCVTPDGKPVVGETDVEGFFVATGLSGQGITLGPACAAVLATVLDDESGADLAADLSPNRDAIDTPRA